MGFRGGTGVRNRPFQWATVEKAGVVHAFAGPKSMCGLAKRPEPQVDGKFDVTGAVCFTCRRSVRDYEEFRSRLKLGFEGV